MKTLRKGFSLVEILVVLGIVVLLASISVPVLNSINKGADLGFAATQATGQIDLARQSAATMSRVMEVRIYETKDGSGNVSYNALAIYEIGEDGSGNETFTLQNKIQYLPQGAVFSPTGLSTLITDVPDKGEDAIPGQGSVKYSAFRFRPSGTVEFDSNPVSGPGWTLAIVSQKDATASVLPANYALLTLNPSVGMVRVTRP